MEFKMNPKVKDRWVAALRSGAYRQGRGTLRYRETVPDSRAPERIIQLARRFA